MVALCRSSSNTPSRNDDGTRHSRSNSVCVDQCASSLTAADAQALLMGLLFAPLVIYQLDILPHRFS